MRQRDGECRNTTILFVPRLHNTDHVQLHPETTNERRTGKAHNHNIIDSTNISKTRTIMKAFALFYLLVLGSRAQFTGRLHGVNYSLRIGPDWTFGAERCKSRDRITSELTTLKFDMTDNVRVFSMTDCDTAGTMLELTQDVDMGLWLGIWVGPNGTVFEDERARLLQLLQTHSFANVLGIHVSSEAIYREEITPEEAISLHSTIKDDLAAAGLQDIPVTI